MFTVLQLSFRQAEPVIFAKVDSNVFSAENKKGDR